MKRARPKNDKDYSEVQKLKRENDKLKKQISGLRRQLSRLDIDAYSNLKEIIESHDRQDAEFDTESELLDLQKKWECNTCARDFLRLIIVPRLDGNFYFRKCGNCGHKTKLKKYKEDIEGIDSYGKLVKKGEIKDK